MFKRTYLMLENVDRYRELYHGTALNSGYAIIKEGICIPKTTRWFVGGRSAPLEHGFRFYTCARLEAAKQFATNGMILKFKSPFPKGAVGIIRPGLGGGFVQVSFGEDVIDELMKRLVEFSTDEGSTWSPVFDQYRITTLDLTQKGDGASRL